MNDSIAKDLTATVVAGSSDPAFIQARDVIDAAESHDESSPVSDQAMLAAAEQQRTMLLFRDSQTDVARAVGVVGDGEIDLVVHPESRGRGIGTSALSLLLERADRIDESPVKAGPFKAWSHGDNPAADALLSHASFSPVRSLLRLALAPERLPSDSQDPLLTPVSNGNALRTFDPESPFDRPAWVRVNAAAFATHPEQGRITEHDFALMTQEPWFDPADLFLLAGPDSLPGSAGSDLAKQRELAGYTWIKTLSGDADSPPECELYAIGVHPDHAGHGLGRTLLDVTLRRMSEHHPHRVTLYVDGDNERAVQLYVSAGFTIDSRSQQWERQPSAPVSARIGA